MSKKKGFFYNVLGVSNIKMGFNYTKSSFLKLLSSRIDPTEETFEEACIRFGVIGTSDVVNPILKEKYMQYKKNFYVKSVFSFIVFLLSIYYVTVDDQVLNGAMCFLLSLAILSFSMTDSLNCYHINKRTLGLSREWIKSPKNWFPISFENLKVDIIESINKESENE